MKTNKRKYFVGSKKLKNIKMYEHFGVETSWEDFLVKINQVPESHLRDLMGEEYIDTPGSYEKEKEDYDDVVEYMISNMGRSEYKSLQDWFDANPEKVEMIMSVEESSSILEKKWSGKIETEWHPKEGIFKESAEKIAKYLKSKSDGLKQAMSRLNFYINRAGKNLSADDKNRLENAKDKLRSLY